MGSMAFDLYNFKWEASPGLGMFDILHVFVQALHLFLTDNRSSLWDLQQGVVEYGATPIEESRSKTDNC